MPLTSLVAVDLAPVIEEAVRRAVASVGERQVAITAQYPAHLPAVQAEPQALTSMVELMVRQAAGLVAQGEVRVRAELTPADAPEGIPAAAVYVRVAPDQVSPQAADRLGRRQAQPASRSDLWPELEGVRTQTESWNGGLSTDWQAGRGAEFRLSLPLWAARELAGGLQPQEPAVGSRLSALHPEARTLLLMVEDPGLRATLASDLEEAGYSLLIAERGTDVLPLARQQKPDLVLLDVMLRDPPPFDLAMLIKRDRAVHATPVLFLTSGTEEQQGHQVGAVDFVVRPSGTGAILTAIQSVLSAGVRRSGRVMVVEPDALLRENMITMLQHQAFRVTEATGAEEALVLAERLEPALVLVNARLAQARDYWLLRRLRQLSDGIQIVVMAEALSEAEGQAAMRRGASGFGETGRLPDLLDQVRRRAGSA